MEALCGEPLSQTRGGANRDEVTERNGSSVVFQLPAEGIGEPAPESLPDWIQAEQGARRVLLIVIEVGLAVLLVGAILRRRQLHAGAGNEATTDGAKSRSEQARSVSRLRA